MQRLLTGASTEFAREKRLYRKDGATIWVNLTVSPTWQPGETPQHHIAVVEDISTRKQAEADLHRANEAVRRLNDELEQRVRERTAQLEAANKELEAFSYSVSHDLRAPLRAIDGFSRILLKKHAQELNAKGMEYLQLVRNSTKQMGQLVDDLLAFARLSRQPIHLLPVEPHKIIQQCLADLQSEQEGRRVEVSVGDLPPCQGDPALLKQVWTNLLSNALKYTKKRDAAKIEIGCRKDIVEGEATYYIMDNGVGFDMHYAHKLFGVFQRLHRAEEIGRAHV